MDGGRPPTEANHHQQVALDIKPAWWESINYRADMSSQRKPQAKPTIFRVPPTVRYPNQGAYEPKVVSIGPYHRGKSEDFMAMEEIKWRLLHDYLSKVPNGSNNEGLRKLKDLEKRARDCYWEVIDLDSDRFVEMLLIDGCFLVQIFIAITDGILPAELIFHNVWISGLLFRDLLLLENQIPYFIVDHLLNTLGMPEWNSSRLQNVAISFFANWFGEYRKCPQDQELPDFRVDHLLHLFHWWICINPELNEVSNARCCNNLSPELRCSSSLNRVIDEAGNCLSKMLPYRTRTRTRSINTSHPDEFLSSVPSMTELVEAGVKIEVREANSFLDIVFRKDRGVLRIPAIEVDTWTNSVFANLMALEQSSHQHGMKITAYNVFFDGLIDTSRDVELLRQKGILERNYDDSAVAFLFNNIVEDVFYDSETSYLRDVVNDLNVYCQSRWRRWRAKAVRDYFSNPWAIISLGAAVLLLGLTIVQSVYAVLDH